MKLKFKIIILCVICFIIFIGAIVADKIINKSNLVELSYNEVIEKINNKDTFILVISQTTCFHCARYKPIIDEIAKKHNLTVYFVESDLFSEEEGKNFITYIIYKKGREVNENHRLFVKLPVFLQVETAFIWQTKSRRFTPAGRMLIKCYICLWILRHTVFANFEVQMIFFE